MAFNKFKGKPGNIIPLSQYARILKWSKILKNIKNFYTYNTLFKYWINIHIIAIIMVKKTWISFKPRLPNWTSLALLNRLKSCIWDPIIFKNLRPKTKKNKSQDYCYKKEE